jgi:hypothetical protein
VALAPVTRSKRPRDTFPPPMPTLFGRFFQLLGMILLPIGLMIGMLQDNVNLEVRLLFIGGAFFLVGWLMARKK